MIAVLLLSGRIYTTQSAIGGDAVYNFMNLRSLIIDRDLDLKNEYLYFYNQTSKLTQNRKVPYLPKENPTTGLFPNKYPLGMVLVLAPFFILGHITAILSQLVGFNVNPDGYHLIYQVFSALGSMACALLGLYFIYNYCKKKIAPNIALAGVMVTLFATPLIYYVSMEPLMSHAISMAVASIFILLWMQLNEKSGGKDYFILGLAGGLLGLIRYQDIFFLLIPVISALYGVFKEKQSLTSFIKNRGTHFLLYGLAAGMIFSIQLIANKYLYGKWLDTGYTGEGAGFPYLLSPKFYYTLFSAESGLLLWSPVISFAFVGLFWLTKRNFSLGIFLWLAFFMQWYIVSSWHGINQGHSFGNRMLLSTTVIFAFGLIEFYSQLQTKKKIFPLVSGLSILFIAINAVVAGLYCFRVIGYPY